VGLPDLLLHVAGLARGAWPLLTGVPVGLRGTLAGEITMVPSALRLQPGGVLLATALLAVYGIAAVAAARHLARPRSVAGGTAAGLLVLVLVNLGVALGTPFGRALADDARYLVPLYTALPVLAGAWLARLPPAVGAALAAGLVLVHAADAATGSFRNLSPAVAAGERAVLQTQLATVAALERLGITRLYAPDFGTRVMTFLSRERVIFSNHYEEIYPPYVLAVDGAERAGWWMSGRDPLFDANLAALGVQASFQWASPLGGAFTDFVLTAPPVRELDPARWRLTASANEAVAPAVADRDAATLWSTGRPKQGGEWLGVDLGAVEPVALVRWLPGTYQEVPGGLVLEVSRDGEAWQRAIELPAYIGPLYWSAGRPMGRVRAGRVELRLPGTAARHLRITQTGANRLWPWTVRELHVYAAAGPAPAPAIALDGPALARALRTAGVTRLYADHGWGARAALADPAVRIAPANIAVDAYNFPGSARDFLAPVHWDPGSGILAEPGDVEGIAAVLRAAGLGHADRAIGPLTLLAYAPPPVQPGRAVDRRGLAVTASREPGRAARAVDGDPATRWATAHPQTPGDWVRVDLDRPRLVRAVRLLSANPMDQPRGLRLEGSEDGAAWRPLAAETHREGPLRWAGIALLRDGTEALRLDVAPVRVAALRLTLTAGHPVFDWSIHELTVYAED
jgi:hypothetical protein